MKSMHTFIRNSKPNPIHIFLRITALLFSVVCFSETVESQPVRVSNREPRPNEVHYYPEDGDVSPVSPPGFVWLPEDNAVGYILQCSTDPSFQNVEYEMRNISLNVHCPSVVLDIGTWYWRYAYLNKNQEVSNWSKVRRFEIKPHTIPFPQPKLDQLRASIPEQHPRLFLRPELVESFQQFIKQNHSELWDRFIQNADRQMETPVVQDEPPQYTYGLVRSKNKEDIDIWRANRRITVQAVEHAANLAFAYCLTGEEKYGQRAKEWILAVMSWPPDGTTSYQNNDECAMPILSRIARAYTWAYPLFSEDEKAIVIENFKQRGSEVYHHLKDVVKHTVTPYGSHDNRAWHFMGEAAIVFHDTIPEAPQWLQYAMDTFFNVYPVWGDTGGGWHEGLAYWRSYIERVTWWLDIMRTAFQIDGYKKPYFFNAGYFPLYVQPPGQEFGGFGDSADTLSWKQNTGLMFKLASEIKNPFWMGYAAQNESLQTIPESPTYLDLLRIPISDVPPESPQSLSNSKIFAGVGIASLHSDLINSSSDVHLLFKSSPFGRQSHGFNAQNSFVLWGYGKPLLHWSGHRDWHGSEHHTNWMWNSVSDNSITVNGKGQIPHDNTARGKIVDSFFSREFDYIAGDATEAYDGRLSKFIRHIFFIKPDAFLIVDELEAPEPSTFELQLHADNPFTIESPQRIETSNDTSSVIISFATGSDLTVSQTEDMVPPPVGMDLHQWHLEAKTHEKKTKHTFITFMKVKPKGQDTNLQTDFKKYDQHTTHAYALDKKKQIALVYNPDGNPIRVGILETNATMSLVTADFENKGVPSLLSIQSASTTIDGHLVWDKEERGKQWIPHEQFKQYWDPYAKYLKAKEQGLVR